MAKGDYYFPLYYKRLLSSTVGWKDDEFGAYMRLLIYQFDNGSVPTDIKELSRIISSAKKNWKFLSKKFHENGNGGLINDVMTDVRNDANKKAERARENGKSGGRPKPRHNPEKTQPVISGFQNDNPDESYLITNNQELIIKENKEKVENKKLSKKQFRKNISLTEDEHSRLIEDFGEVITDKAYDYLSNYKIEKDYKTKNDNLTIRRWVIEAVRKKANGVIPSIISDIDETKAKQILDLK